MQHELAQLKLDSCHKDITQTDPIHFPEHNLLGELLDLAICAVHPLVIHGIELLLPSLNDSILFSPYRTDISRSVNAGIFGNNRIVPHCWPPSTYSMPSGECDVLSWS